VSKPKPRITIVGLGLIGGSLGLALREAEVASVIVGHDKELTIGKQAKRVGAVDQVEWNLISACENSDLVILATPVGAIRPTLEAIAQYLKPYCVVIDTASLKEQVLHWADEILPEQVFFVGSNPILNVVVEGQGGLDAARPDLFQRGLFCLVPSVKADPAAVKLAADLVTILGARPLFLDAAEHDGLLAAVSHLPPLLGLALLEMAMGQPTWRELRKVAGSSFELSTQLPFTDAAGYSELCVSNRDNILRWLDAFSASLASIRELLAEGQSEELTQRFEEALAQRREWLQDRAEGRWEEDTGPEVPERVSLTENLLGTFWRRKPKRDE
jgi:prephenate dehydrogenase